MKMFIKSFLLAVLTVLTFASYAFVGPGQAVKMPPDGNIPTYWHNAPIVLEHFEDNTAVKIPLGAQNPSVLNGTQVEYYIITNGGDSTKKPDLSVTASKTGFTFRDTETGIESPAWTLKWGETGLFTQEVGQSDHGHFTRLKGKANPSSLPIATDTAVGAVKGGSSIGVATDGSIFLKPDQILNAQVASGSNAKIWARMYDSGSGHSNAPAFESPASQYLLLGGREYGANTARGIGFGYVVDSKTLAPAFIGYQEKVTTSNTVGDLYFATRSGSSNTGRNEVLRLTYDGDIRAANDYTPKNANSLVNKSYVDRVRGTAQQFASDYTLSSFRSGDILVASPPGNMTFTVPAATTFGIVGGDRVTFSSFAKKGSVVTVNTADNLLTYSDSGVVLTKTFSLSQGESATIAWDANYRRWLLLRGAPAAASGADVISTEGTVKEGDQDAPEAEQQQQSAE